MRAAAIQAAADDRNPRTMQLAQQLRSAHPDDMEFVRAVLAMFTQQPFYYTLTPPKLADDSVDEFLFDTQARLLRTLRLGICRPGARGRHTGARRDRISGRNAQSVRRIIGLCGKAMRMPGMKSGSRDAAGCASIPPRRSLRSAWSAA